MELIRLAEKVFASQPEASLVEAFKLLSLGKTDLAEERLAAAIGIAKILDGQLEWINHPERVLVEKVERVGEGIFRVTVKYQNEEYRTTVRCKVS